MLGFKHWNKNILWIRSVNLNKAGKASNANLWNLIRHWVWNLVDLADAFKRLIFVVNSFSLCPHRSFYLFPETLFSKQRTWHKLCSLLEFRNKPYCPLTVLCMFRFLFSFFKRKFWLEVLFLFLLTKKSSFFSFS